ncbi:sensor domain-containing diguanylate cyclase [Gallionella capsiferriformans]|nr:MASE3 domain-containing protein [Gallionella capsiferriformans]
MKFSSFSVMSLKRVFKPSDFAAIALLLGIFLLLELSRSIHYLFFHTMVELLSIVVSISIFILIWASHRQLANGYLIILGGAYGAIGLIDVFHTLTFKGMNLFPAIDVNYTNQFWLTARFLEAAALLVAPLYINKKPNLFHVSLIFFLLAAVAGIAVINRWFPATFVTGTGLTPFKIYSEIIIIAVMLSALFLLYQRREHFDRRIFFLLQLSLILAIVGEFCFTLYAGFYDFTHALGHYIRFVSVAAALAALVISGIRRPLNLLFRELSEHRKSQDELNHKLAKSVSLLNATVESTDDAILVVDLDGTWVLHNKRFDELWDISDELIASQDDRAALTYVLDQLQDPDSFLAHVGELYATPDANSFDTLEFKNGKTIERYSFPQKVDGRVVGRVWRFRDITERKAMEDKLRYSEQRFQDVSNAAGEYVWEIDINLIYTYVSLRSIEVKGYLPEQLIGHTPVEFMHPDDINTVGEIVNHAISNKSAFNLQHRDITPSGEVVWEEVNGTPYYDHKGNVIGLRGTGLNITDRKSRENQIHRLAFYDPLTKLPNRRLLNERLLHTLATIKRNDRYGALMFLDLDHFKPLNDAYGHVAGDLLLIEATRRMEESVRAIDTIARFGGDEFVVLLSDLETNLQATLSDAHAIAEKIRTTLSVPYQLTILDEKNMNLTVEHTCSASIGICIFNATNSNADEILQRADEAMYQAKKSGRNCIRIHSSTDELLK